MHKEKHHMHAKFYLVLYKMFEHMNFKTSAVNQYHPKQSSMGSQGLCLGLN